MTRDMFGEPTPPSKPPRDPFGTARRYRLRLRGRDRKGAMLRGDRIYYDVKASLDEQRAMIAECVRKHVLRMSRQRAVRRIAA